MHYVYFLKSAETKWIYIGNTNDLKRRLAEHNSGKTSFTRERGPWELIYYEAYKDKRDALSREQALKKYGSGLGQLKQRLAFSLAQNGRGGSDDQMSQILR
jgi:putative endonuclease